MPAPHRLYSITIVETRAQSVGALHTPSDATFGRSPFGATARSHVASVGLGLVRSSLSLRWQRLATKSLAATRTMRLLSMAAAETRQATAALELRRVSAAIRPLAHRWWSIAPGRAARASVGRTELPEGRALVTRVTKRLHLTNPGTHVRRSRCPRAWTPVAHALSGCRWESASCVRPRVASASRRRRS
jgi:hypothetical protein